MTIGLNIINGPLEWVWLAIQVKRKKRLPLWSVRVEVKTGWIFFIFTTSRTPSLPSLQMNFHLQTAMTVAKRKHATCIIIKKKLPSTLTWNNGVGKLFKISRWHCKCFNVMFQALEWKFTDELLSLQAKIDPLPPSYLCIAKIEFFQPNLTAFFTATESMTWQDSQSMGNFTVAPLNFM